MSCERCGGFKIYDYFYSGSACEGFRCINCGAVTDLRMIIPVRPQERHLANDHRNVPLTASQ